LGTFFREAAVISQIALSIAVAMFGATMQATHVVTKVPSGDSVEVSGLGRIRLAGIRSTDEPAFRLGGNTPSSAQPPRTDPGARSTPAVSGSYRFKREQPARTFLQKLALGKEVRVEIDPVSKDTAVAYVYLPDGTLVNAEMLRTGLARLDLSKPFERVAEFKQLEADARAANLGIWAGWKGR
jgi:micrococcal nuclease